jgi:hypothetical protein
MNWETSVMKSGDREDDKHDGTRCMSHDLSVVLLRVEISWYLFVIFGLLFPAPFIAQSVGSFKSSGFRPVRFFLLFSILHAVSSLR